MGKAAEGVSPGRSRTSAQPTIGGSTYVKPQDMDWAPTQFAGVSIKVLYEDKEKGEMTASSNGRRVHRCPCISIPRLSKLMCSKARSTIMMAFVALANTSGDGSAPSTRRIPTRVRSSWRYTGSPTFSRTAPVTLAPTTENAFAGRGPHIALESRDRAPPLSTLPQSSRRDPLRPYSDRQRRRSPENQDGS
jgi:hypothetical protein